MVWNKKRKYSRHCGDACRLTLIKEMKKIIYLSLLILLASCSSNKYESRVQAVNACNDWREKGEKQFHLNNKTVFSSKIVGKKFSKLDSFYKSYVSMTNTRWCIQELETDQMLGYELKGTKGDKIYKNFKREKGEIVKNFKY